jgi:hypothetical protein
VDALPDHFRNPYPTPTCVVRPSYLPGWTLVLPDTLPRSPKRSPEPLSLSEALGHTRREEAKPEPKSPSTRVKVEPFGPTDSSITRGEPGKGHLPMTRQSRLMVAAYEPSQGSRPQIAWLNASRSQGAQIPLPVRWES